MHTKSGQQIRKEYVQEKAEIDLNIKSNKMF